MGNDSDPFDGYPTPESRGIDRGYRAERKTAKQELAATKAGPDDPLKEPEGDGIKNPDGEFAMPAAMTGPRPDKQAGPAPNQVGNSSGRGPIDPQGQQAGTGGGQAGSPPVASRQRAEGTPLAAPDERSSFHKKDK